MGLMRIGEYGEAAQYLDNTKTEIWRKALRDRFAKSPLLEHDAIWRLLCYELALNVAEHAGAHGFLAAHVIRADTNISSFAFAADFRKRQPGPFLELCVADAGIGLVSSLTKSFRAIHQISPKAEINSGEVVSFALHELGSRKDFLDSLATDRHALARCLSLVEQYAGLLRIRAGGTELQFDASMGPLKRSRARYGYLPTADPIPWPSSIEGTHIQILLPLYPKAGPDQGSALARPLPTNFQIEPAYPIGHYVPLASYFDDQHSSPDELFRSTCHRLAESLLFARPLDEPIAFDLDGLNWSRGHLETFVTYMENVLSRRAILFLRVPASIADELNRASDVSEELDALLAIRTVWKRILIRAAPLLDSAQKKLVAATNVLNISTIAAEIGISPVLLKDQATLSILRTSAEAIAASGMTVPVLFVVADKEQPLKLYSGNTDTSANWLQLRHDVWDTVLLLDTDKRVRIITSAGPACARALESLIHTPRSAENLATEFRTEEPLLTASLLRSVPLFSQSEEGVWSCAWNDATLHEQAQRSVYFDLQTVLNRTEAWRGRKPWAPTGAPFNAFYLPWDHLWIDGFLECARIFSRERYVDEIAQRLVSLLRRRLKGQTSAITTFVAATTPALILATGIAKWWAMFENKTAQYPVLDLGSYLFRDRPSSLGVRGEVVIVQDVLSTGTQTTKLLAAIREANSSAIHILAFAEMQNSSALGYGSSHPFSGDPSVILQALLTVPRPRTTDALLTQEHAYWVEPRTLRPIHGRNLLEPRFGSFRSADTHDDHWPQPRDLLTEAANRLGGAMPLIRAGHYMIGERHHEVAVDIRRLSEGEIGDRIAQQIADVCDGGPNKQEDVSVVVMPLDSEIIYLWRKVQALLDRRGRRQPFWFLESTIELGDAPFYLTPRSLQAQAKSAAKHGQPLRILALDEEMITGATAHQLLVTLQYATQKGTARYRRSAVEWVRYLCLVDRQADQEQRFTGNLRAFGAPAFLVRFESVFAMTGIRAFSEESCPACLERRDIEAVRASNIGAASPQLTRWCSGRLTEIRPVRLDTALEELPTPLPGPIRVFEDDPSGDMPTADLAIARFLQLMSRGFPVAYVLAALNRPPYDSTWQVKEVEELERYRWHVLSWCLQHWERYAALPSAGHDLFRKNVLDDINFGTWTLPRVLTHASRLAHTADGFGVFVKSLETFSALAEAGRLTTEDPTTFRKAVALETGLLGFLALMRLTQPVDIWKRYEEKLRDLAAAPNQMPNWIGVVRLLARWNGSNEDTPPRSWALQTIAENLSRERSPDFSSELSHDLLLKLLARMRQDPDPPHVRHFTAELLALFIRAVETLEGYTGFFSIGPARDMLRCAHAVLQSLETETSGRPRDLDALQWHFERYSDRFLGAFADRFNVTVDELCRRVQAAAKERAPGLVIDIRSEVESGATILCDFSRLKYQIVNWLIDPLPKHKLEPASRNDVVISRVVDSGRRDRIVIRMKTTFLSHAETKARLLRQSSKYGADIGELEAWDVKHSLTADGDGWPVFELSVPIGFHYVPPSQGVFDDLQDLVC